MHLTEKELKIFYDNGYTNEDIQAAYDAAADNGLSDKEIYKNIQLQIKELNGEQPEKKGIDLTSTKEEINEDIKQKAQERLNARNIWEEEHPFISRMQADYQPGYRAARTRMEREAQYGLDAPLKEVLTGIAKEAGQSAIPYINSGRDAALTLLTKGKGGFLPNIAKAAEIGAAQSSTADALDELSNNGVGNVLGRATEGAIGGGGTGGGIALLLNSLPYVNKIPGVSNVGNYLNRVSSGAGRGFLESFAMGKNVMDRLASSPRGTEISKNADYYGTPQFLNDIANRFKEGLDTFKNQEKIAFTTARDNLIKNNQDNFDITNIIKQVYDDLAESGLTNKEGITRTGYRAANLPTFLDDLAEYEGKTLTANELQKFKTQILDDIIDYRPDAGQKLNASTRELQNITKNARYNINSLLQEKMGAEYTAANKKIANILDVLNNTPELKDLTNNLNIDTLANKLKQAGTQRLETQKQLRNLEKLMKENGVSVSDTTLADDILDYQAAKEIQDRIRTGQDTQFRNIPRKALLQPATEFYFDRIKPALTNVKNTAPTIKELLEIVKLPALKGASNVAENMLYGGVEYNDYR